MAAIPALCPGFVPGRPGHLVLALSARCELHFGQCYSLDLSFADSRNYRRMDRRQPDGCVCGLSKGASGQGHLPGVSIFKLRSVLRLCDHHVICTQLWAEPVSLGRWLRCVVDARVQPAVYRQCDTPSHAAMAFHRACYDRWAGIGHAQHGHL